MTGSVSNEFGKNVIAQCFAHCQLTREQIDTKAMHLTPKRKQNKVKQNTVKQNKSAKAK